MPTRNPISINTGAPALQAPQFEPYKANPIDLSGQNKINPEIAHPSGMFKALPPRKLQSTPGMHQANPTDQDPFVPNQQGFQPPPSLGSVLAQLKAQGGSQSG